MNILATQQVIIYRSQSEANFDKMMNEHPEEFFFMFAFMLALVVIGYLVGRFVFGKKSW